MYRQYTLCDDRQLFGSSAPIGGKRSRALLILNGVLDSFVNLPGYKVNIHMQVISRSRFEVTSLKETKSEDCRRLTCNV